jgi:basic membrane lipoprotein Med (substrate-binding protein (PBP1-ABC) superfamily)
MSAKYTEKILRSIPISVVDLIIKRKAVYLKDILNNIMSNKLKINNVYFYNLKNYGNVKVKKTGRIKRKIKKKVISQNRIQD